MVTGPVSFVADHEQTNRPETQACWPAGRTSALQEPLQECQILPGGGSDRRAHEWSDQLRKARGHPVFMGTIYAFPESVRRADAERRVRPWTRDVHPERHASRKGGIAMKTFRALFRWLAVVTTAAAAGACAHDAARPDAANPADDMVTLLA